MKATLHRVWVLALLCVFASVVETAYAEDLPEGTLCPVSAEAVDPEVSSDYRSKKVYFCCEDCQKAFEESPATYATKSNLQLVVTGQFTQFACPFSGRPTKTDKTVEVDGVSVAFCCGNCVKKVEDAATEERTEMVFGEDDFEKGFKAGT